VPARTPDLINLRLTNLPPDAVLTLDSGTVRAKHGGALTGLDPTDRGKRGTKYQGAVTGDGVPVACLRGV
jgi:hypothetical protein